MKSQLTLGVVVGLVLALIVLMSLHDWNFRSSVKQEVLKQSPMITTQGVTGRVFDVNGELRYTIEATHASEYDYTQALELTQPHIQIFSGDDHWIVDAAKGRMQGLGQASKLRQITLQQDVTAHLVGPDGVHLASDELHYWPASGKLVSPGPTKMRQQKNTTQAGHLVANTKTGKISLSKGVESHYVAPAS